MSTHDDSPIPYANPDTPFPAPAPLKTGLARASLVCGLLSFCIPVVSAVAAIVLGVIALRKARDPKFGGRGPAIAGICLGVVSLPLLAFGLREVKQAREQALVTYCASNLSQRLFSRLAENAGAEPARGSRHLCLSVQQRCASDRRGPRHACGQPDGARSSFVHLRRKWAQLQDRFR